MKTVVLVIVMTLALLPFQSGNGPAAKEAQHLWQSALSESLSSTYSLSKVAMFGNGIKEAGTIVVVRRDGLSGVTGGTADNLVRDGQIQQKGRSWVYALDAANRKTYKVGDRHYINRCAVKEAEVQISLISLETYDVITKGTSRSERLCSEVHFQFAPGELDTMPFSQVRSAISAVLAREEDLAVVKTVTLGQTKEQVEAALGKPDTVIDLGPKVVYVYPKLKVVFIDGKVSDVE